jgi:hypothetical protein
MGAQQKLSMECDCQAGHTLQAIFDTVWREIRLIRQGDEEKRRHDLALTIILAHQSGMPSKEIMEALTGEIASPRRLLR